MRLVENGINLDLFFHLLVAEVGCRLREVLVDWGSSVQNIQLTGKTMWDNERETLGNPL